MTVVNSLTADDSVINDTSLTDDDPLIDDRSVTNGTSVTIGNLVMVADGDRYFLQEIIIFIDEKMENGWIFDFMIKNIIWLQNI